jgi:CRP/FNR family transcriptional regulator, cyclic AMP receptor protein
MSTNDERLNILQSISLFSGSSTEVLLELADKLEVESAQPGDLIVRQGEMGSCMYVVIDGKVRIHEGERTLNYLGRGDFFGEMAVLDPMPRSTTVTAIEVTRLYRLEREAVVEVMIKQPEIAQGVIRTLCRRLRGNIVDMAKDFQYITQFSRVIEAAVAVEKGVYEPEFLDDVAARPDDLGKLAQVFQKMVNQVKTREERLKMQLNALVIEIDEVKKERQVATITESEYFISLKEKANQLRSQKGTRSTGTEQNE